MNNTFKVGILGLVVGAICGAVITLVAYKPLTSNEQETIMSKATNEPLYWVAPMDDSYRRDQPGQSPMGMDLVPVFANKTENDSVGTVKISPEVVNNLGVRIAPVAMRVLEQEISTVGYVTYDEDKLVHIHPRVDGWIENLYVKSVGEPVKKNQPLYDIYSPELVNAQEELLLALTRKNSQLIQAAENRLVALQLPKSSIIRLKKTRKVAQRVTFYAPQNGVIEKLNIREGFYVKPGATLMSIGDLSEVWVEAEVFERQASNVNVGASVTLTLDYLPGKTWKGNVDYVYPTLTEKTRTVKVRLRFDNALLEFKPNMFAQVVIHAQDQPSVITIPKEALIRTGGQERVVLALGKGKFKSIAVRSGQFDNNYVQILEGISVDDSVVTSAQFLLDSESSKSSDFKRMHFEAMPSEPNAMNDMPMDNIVDKDRANESMAMDTAAQASRATVEGEINMVMASHRMLNISRAAIEKWQRPAATMDFIVAQEIDLNQFVAGMSVEFTFEIRSGEFVIIDIATKEHVSIKEAAKVSELNNESAEKHDNH